MRYLVIIMLLVPAFALTVNKADISPTAQSSITQPEKKAITPKGAAIETLKYDDGAVSGGWHWNSGGSGWGGFFDAGGECNILEFQMYLWRHGETAPDSFGALIVDDNNGSPGTTVWDDQELSTGMGPNIHGWYYHQFSSPIYDSDGKFYVFWVQANPDPAVIICCDIEQNHPNVWWYVHYPGGYGPGFPGGDAMIRAVVESPPGIEEQNVEELNFLTVQTVNNGLLKITFARSGDYLIKVYNPTGSLINSTDLKPDAGNTITLDLTHLPAGIYFLKISNGFETRTVKTTVIR